MKKNVFFLTILTTVICFTNSFAFQNEPDGFRGIKWGTKIETLKDMRKLYTKGNTTVYMRKNDKLQIGDAELQNISYMFWQDKFYSVYIQTKGYLNWAALKKVLFLKFGKGNQDNKYTEYYRWGLFSGKVVIYFKYNQISEQGTLMIRGNKIVNEMRQSKRQKGKERVIK
jgi:hypothetical protein